MIYRYTKCKQDNLLLNECDERMSEKNEKSREREKERDIDIEKKKIHFF
jgi:hypothetical protein